MSSERREMTTRLLEQLLNPMSPERILDLVAQRGCKLIVEGGRVVARGPKDSLTPALLNVLRLHHEALLDRLRPKELLYPGTGRVGPHWFPQAGWPVGAKFWRYAGETAWTPIPEAERPRPSPAHERQFDPATERLAEGPDLFTPREEPS